MIYAAILAGGVGNRMGEVDKPKQFLTLGDKPILIQTVEKFYLNHRIDKVIVLCHKYWINHTNDLINEFMPNAENIVVVEGGMLRNDTIMNAVNYIEESFGINEDDIIITHDSVRPFVTHRIIMENIEKTIEVGACDTVIPATDTIVVSRDKKLISQIPKRDFMYQGQTPQSFNILKLKEFYDNLSEDEKKGLSDAAKIFVLNGHEVAVVNGEVFNIKITYPYDLKVANTIIDEAKLNISDAESDHYVVNLYDFEESEK
ncbi:2-C-methyl-D-erythritol 4-phosphate cytidylyltransferase [uncultured Methanobrevibacter sp.]|uniref:IspD/TarI family cytidylyltransferase n=1 Tax=uncultured Methanobrevibacter sp. TaxID=253161 RepID=UPI002612572B